MDFLVDLGIIRAYQSLCSWDTCYGVHCIFVVVVVLYVGILIVVLIVHGILYSFIDLLASLCHLTMICIHMLHWNDVAV